MRECPKCGAPTTGPVCPACGEGRAPKKAKALPPDPHRHRCAFESFGQRCANPGSLSEATMGSERWHCAQHFKPWRHLGVKNPIPLPARDWTDYDSPEDSAKNPRRQWARRIIKAHACGDYHLLSGIEAAREALKSPASDMPIDAPLPRNVVEITPAVRKMKMPAKEF